MTLSLTHRQTAALDFIAGHIARTGGTGPSLEEVANHLGLKSKSAGHRIVTLLEGRGLIRRGDGRARCIELVEPCTVTLPADIHASLRRIAERDGCSIDQTAAECLRAWLSDD